MSAQALDRLGHRGVDLLGQVDQEGQASISPSPTRRLQARRTRRTKALYWSFLTCRRGRFAVNPTLTVRGLESGTAVMCRLAG